MAEASTEEPERRATVTIDAQGFFKAVSPQFLSLIGRAVETLAGVSLTDLVHPNDAASLRQLLATAAAGSAAATPIHLFVEGDQWLPVRAVARPGAEGRVVLALIPQSPPPAVDDAVEDDPVENGDTAEDDAAEEETASFVADAADTSESALAARDLAATNDEPTTASNDESGSAALFPGPEVPGQRAAIRSSVGGTDTPMIELDDGGHTAFVTGAWQELSTTNVVGADAYVELVVSSNQADAIQRAIDTAVAEAVIDRFEVDVAAVGTRWLHVLPLPSPHLAGVVHALVAVSTERELLSTEAEAVAAPTAPIQAPTPTPQPKDEAPSPDAVPTAAPIASAVAGPAAAVAAEVGADEEIEPSPSRNPVSRVRVPRRPNGLLRRATPSAPLEMLQGAGRSTRVIGIVAGFLTYLAMQGLYLGPTYDWPSPLQGFLDSQRCLIQPLCDDNVLPFIHVSVFALILAVFACALLFRRVGPRKLATGRPVHAADLAATSWRPTLSGPGPFAWLCVLAVGVVSGQTLFTDSVSTWVWIAASAFGAIAAWRADRDALVPLAGTMAAVAVAMSCLLVPLGIGSIWLGENTVVGIALLLVGCAMFLYALRLNAASESSFDSLDFAAMLGFAVLALVLGLLRHHTWRYAFIGDEWSFYEGALDGLRGNSRLSTFDIGGPNNYFTGLTFELQGAVMRVAGDDVWGWRLSSLMPMVLSTAAMYAFTRWLAGRTAALAAAIALAAGHMLLSFSMVGYNNSQSLVAVSASFAALAWAHQRPSALRFFLLGSAVGSTFLVYAMARLALVPLALLFLVLFRKSVASFGRRLGWASLGGLAMAAPALFSWENWEALLKATPVQAEDPVLAAGGVTRQIVENTFAGWLSFIGSTRNTHFVVGPHLDVISAVLLIVGAGYILARARHDKAMLWFLVGGFALWTGINAIQQYAQISNTRSFMTPLVYCVFIGVGAAAVLPMVIARVPKSVAPRLAGLGVLAGFVLILVGLNQWHIGSYANERQQLTEQAMLVQQFELTESVDGQGMQVIVGWPEDTTARLNMVLRAHDVEPERIVVIPNDGSLNQSLLCASEEPTMLVMHRNHPRAAEWATALSQCWGFAPVEITDPAGAPKLIRTANQAGVQEFALAPAQRVNRGSDLSDYRLADTVDIATDGSGGTYALTRTDDGAAIHRLGDGGSFDLIQDQVIDFDITSDGLFVVAANGGDDRLVWYDGNGNVVNQWAGQADIPAIGGITVAGDRLWASDTNRARLVSFDASFKVDEFRFAEGALLEPGALAAGPDDGLWVYSGRSGEILLVTADDQVSTRLPAQIFNSIDVPRLASTIDGSLIRSIPELPGVELVDASGQVVDARAGMHRPRAAATRSGALVVADPRWHEVTVIAVGDDWAPSKRGLVAWGSRSISVDGQVALESPFVANEAFAPGPLSVELIDTEAVEVDPGQIWRPIGVEILGEVQSVVALAEGAYAADVTGRVVLLDAAGRATKVIGVGTGGATFITDMTVDTAGTTWVLDAGSGQIHRIGSNDEVSVLETDATVLRNARGIATGPDDTLWVASTASAQLTQIASGGSIISTIPLPDRQPSDVVALNDGTFWIVDAQTIELVHLDAGGNVLATVPVDTFSSAESPHLAVLGDQLWVTEPESSAVFAIDTTTDTATGQRIELVRESGTRTDKSIGISAGPDGRLWVVDSIGGAITIMTP